MKDIMIVIPARYSSSRFPGKPLVKIAGIEMLRRVADIARSICLKNADCGYVVATDDERIMAFCQQYDLPVNMTAASCQSGTERAWDVVSQSAIKPQFVINLQGDNPLCPPHVIQALIDQWRTVAADIFTPYIQLSWDEYDRFVQHKKITPYSGTSVLVNKDHFAMAFSKNILPAIRQLSEAKKQLSMSPVKRHVGLYGYTYAALQAYFSLPESLCEKSYIEGLEQMRFLENGLKVKMVEVDYRGRKTTSGVDSPDDVARVEQILAEFGELDLN
ncbi:manno-octulosonate cytidylyltransferase [Utexia brackfieldae]|uniref:3-deoxy-manno-octulosonate cytidylyltransferase family protein n=1 Tax=Utexia brackfieldae TaxID=3074108 RepID=UPI00370DD625